MTLSVKAVWFVSWVDSELCIRNKNHAALDIEILFTKFFRRKSTNIEALLVWYLIKIIRKVTFIMYWVKLLTRKNSLEHRIYLLLKDDCNNGNNYNDLSWAWHIKSGLTIVGFLSDILGKPVTNRYSFRKNQMKNNRSIQAILVFENS